jgi:hypothetical protein
MKTIIAVLALVVSKDQTSGEVYYIKNRKSPAPGSKLKHREEVVFKHSHTGSYRDGKSGASS